MKKLVNSLAENVGLKTKSFSFEGLDFTFSSFSEKDDFYLFLFCSYEDLLVFEDNPNDFEFSLNAIALSIQEEILSDFKNRFLDRNMSFIVVLDCTSGNPNYTQLKKVEENYITAKKYLLVYNQKNFEDLMQQIESNSGRDIIVKLNSLSIEKSHLLTSDDQKAWYLLLMRLFVKLPFLNYQLLDEYKSSLINIEELIDEEFSDEQRMLFKKIDENYVDDLEIEDFLSNHNLIEDE